MLERRQKVSLLVLFISCLVIGFVLILRFGPMERRVAICKLTNGLICISPIMIPAER